MAEWGALSERTGGYCLIWVFKNISGYKSMEDKLTRPCKALKNFHQLVRMEN